MLNACQDGIHFRIIKWFVYQEATQCQLVACWQPYCSEWMIHLRPRASCNDIGQLHLCFTDDLYIEHMKMQCDVVFIAIWVQLIAPITLGNWLAWQIAHFCWPVLLQCILEFDIGGIWIIQSPTAGCGWVLTGSVPIGQPALPRGTGWTWLLAAQFHLKQLMSLSSSWVKKSLWCGTPHISPAVSVLITLSASVEKCIRNSLLCTHESSLNRQWDCSLSF